MSSASSAVTYTFVYTNSEPGRVFWGADEELSDGGSPRVIVYRYDGLPMQPVAPPSPDYIPGLEEPHTPPVPHEELEPMFIHPHDPDYVPELIYPEYIPLEDEHVFLVKEQPLPPVDSPTAESPGYVAESAPEEDPEGYKDDKTEDGLVDYPMDMGDNGDDDDGDSSGDDTDDEDEDEEDEEEEEHLAPTDSAVVIPTVELVSPPKGAELVIPPPSTDTITTGARITVRLQASIPLPPEVEVERLLAMPTPPPSPLTSLSPPSAREHLARIASTQALIDAVTASLPSPPLPPLLPHLYIPPPVDRRDDIPETELPPRKRLCLSVLGFRRQAQMVETLRLIGDMRREMGDMQAELLALREQPRRARQPGSDAKVPDYQDARRDADRPNIPPNNTNPNNMTPESVQARLTKLFCKTPPMETKAIVHTSITEGTCKLGCFDLVDGQIRSLGPDAYSMTWEVLKKKMMDKYCLQGEIKKLEIKLWNLKVKRNDVPTYTERFQELTLICTKFVANETEKIGKNNHGHQQQPVKRHNVAKKCHKCNKVGHVARDCKSSGNTNVANAQMDNRENPKGNGCFECGAPGHFKKDFLKLKNKNKGSVNAQGWVYAVGNAEKKGNASRDPGSNVATGTFLLNNRYASILFDTCADRSFISTAFSSLIDIAPTTLENNYDVELADWKIVRVDTIMRGCTLNFLNHPFNIDLMPVELGSFNVIIGMDWLRRCHAMIVCDEKLVRVPYGNETFIFHGDETNDMRESQLAIISCSKAQEYMTKGCQIFLAHISAKKEEGKSEGKQLKDVPIVQHFSEVFPEDLPGLPPAQPVEFQINLIPEAAPVAQAPYQLAPSKMKELSEQLQELSNKGFIRPSSSPWGALVLFVKKKDGSFRMCIDYREGIHMDLAKIESIKDWASPKTPTEIRQFLSLAGYYRRFIEGFSKIAKSMTKLTQKGIKFNWGEKEENAF
nr:putative reverse transcriptase domain-containing protein [Tanacetum cinerariifolium]